MAYVGQRHRTVILPVSRGKMAINMAILEVPVSYDYSIAAAKDHLTEAIRHAEAGEDVTITRRGRPVAVLVSVARYRQLEEMRPDFWSLAERVTSAAATDCVTYDESDFAGLRDHAPGRDVDL